MLVKILFFISVITNTVWHDISDMNTDLHSKNIFNAESYDYFAV